MLLCLLVYTYYAYVIKYSKITLFISFLLFLLLQEGTEVPVYTLSPVHLLSGADCGHPHAPLEHWLQHRDLQQAHTPVGKAPHAQSSAVSQMCSHRITLPSTVIIGRLRDRWK